VHNQSFFVWLAFIRLLQHGQVIFQNKSHLSQTDPCNGCQSTVDNTCSSRPGKIFLSFGQISGLKHPVTVNNNCSYNCFCTRIHRHDCRYNHSSTPNLRIFPSYHFSWNPIKSFFQIHTAKREYRHWINVKLKFRHTAGRSSPFQRTILYIIRRLSLWCMVSAMPNLQSVAVPF